MKKWQKILELQVVLSLLLDISFLVFKINEKPFFIFKIPDKILIWIVLGILAYVAIAFSSLKMNDLIILISG
ncbi:hypothetical protein [Lactobacillus kalixensis]|uniref:hypothetical protein n=1 Tax=Lactobacillus kalixensis TaxID=227944 RepID=UPI000710306E|nr:hypothetical protein [Lactobacillus kalixensis]